MSLSSTQVKRYFVDGFLIVDDVFSEEELRPLLDGFEAEVGEWADKLRKGGKIADKQDGSHHP